MYELTPFHRMPIKFYSSLATTAIIDDFHLIHHLFDAL